MVSSTTSAANEKKQPIVTLRTFRPNHRKQSDYLIDSNETSESVSRLYNEEMEHNEIKVDKKCDKQVKVGGQVSCNCPSLKQINLKTGLTFPICAKLDPHKGMRLKVM